MAFLQRLIPQEEAAQKLGITEADAEAAEGDLSDAGRAEVPQAVAAQFDFWRPAVGRDTASENLYAVVMDQNVTALERAFQLAKSGSCRSISDVGAALTREGYYASILEGASLKRQLRGFIEAAAAGARA